MTSKIQWTDETIKRFWNNIKFPLVNEDECWNWGAGCFGNGYGQFRIGKKKHRTHRLMYETYIAPIPNGKIVCHKCDNPKCVRPSHLFLGTNKDNSSDRDSKGRGAYNNLKPQPGIKNGSSVLRPNQVIQIMNLFESGSTDDQLSHAYCMSKSQIRNIRNGRAWKCLQIPR